MSFVPFLSFFLFQSNIATMAVNFFFFFSFFQIEVLTGERLGLRLHYHSANESNSNDSSEQCASCVEFNTIQNNAHDSHRGNHCGIKPLIQLNI